MDICHENATCSDVVGGEGSFSCNCNPGYTGNGTTCVGEETVEHFMLVHTYCVNKCPSGT